MHMYNAAIQLLAVTGILKMLNNNGQSLLSGILLSSFKNWGNTLRDKRYAVIYKNLPAEAFFIIKTAFSEMETHKPGTFEMWWAMQHPRFKGQVKDQKMRHVHAIMYKFLTQYARGKLADAELNDEEKKQPDAPKKRGRPPKDYTG